MAKGESCSRGPGFRTVGGHKVANFAGDGCQVAVVWDDVLQPGRMKMDLRSLPDDMHVYDAMDNDLARSGADFAEVGMIPLFVVRPATP